VQPSWGGLIKVNRSVRWGALPLGEVGKVRNGVTTITLPDYRGDRVGKVGDDGGPLGHQ
jgi:hypothetical protein